MFVGHGMAEKNNAALALEMRFDVVFEFEKGDTTLATSPFRPFLALMETTSEESSFEQVGESCGRTLKIDCLCNVDQRSTQREPIGHSKVRSC